MRPQLGCYFIWYQSPLRELLLALELVPARPAALPASHRKSTAATTSRARRRGFTSTAALPACVGYGWFEVSRTVAPLASLSEFLAGTFARKARLCGQFKSARPLAAPALPIVGSCSVANATLQCLRPAPFAREARSVLIDRADQILPDY